MSSTKQGELSGALALVTGASSGFGADFARILAAQGCELVLVARREERLKTLAEELARDHGTVSHVVALSLSEPGSGADPRRPCRGARQARRRAREQRRLRHPRRLPRPAVGAAARAARARRGERRTPDTRLFVPGMRQRGRGWILLVSSIGAFQATPSYAIYSAAKAFVLSFGEALSGELKGSGVKLSVVCPGVAATEFIETAGQQYDALPAAQHDEEPNRRRGGDSGHARRAGLPHPGPAELSPCLSAALRAAAGSHGPGGALHAK